MSSPVPVRADLADVVPYGAPQIDVAVRLNTNETPYPPPQEYLDQLAKRVAVADLHRYPDRRAWALRTALGDRVGLPPERVWAANGSNEVLLQLFQAYGGLGRRLMLVRPGYSAHPLIARVAATDCVEADLAEGFTLSPQAATAAAHHHDPDLICVPSPGAPSGVPLGLDTLRALHDASRGLVVADEAYVEFGGDSAVALLAHCPRLVVVRTFSKAWRMAGLRLGYLYGHDWVVDDLRRVRLPYHLDTLKQEAGLLALEMADEVTAHIGLITAERARLHAALAAMPGVTTWESAGNFLLFRTGVEDLFDRLLARGVLVRDFSTTPGTEGCLRVTIGTPDEDDAFLAALTAALR